MSILPWPNCLTTDLINEYFGEKEEKLSLITAGLIAYSFLFILLLALNIPAAKGISPVNDAQFTAAVLVKVCGS
jgi:hypothetical protein